VNERKKFAETAIMDIGNSWDSREVGHLLASGGGLSLEP
jgi:hypothetical protein